VVIAGSTVSTNLPVSAGNFANHYGLDDGFFARFDVPLAGSLDLGPGWSPQAPTADFHLAQPPVIGQVATGMLTNAPPSSVGTVYVSIQGPTTTVNGQPNYLNPSAFGAVSTFMTSATGTATVTYPVAANAGYAGGVLHVQVAIANSASTTGYEVSNGIRVTLGY
jgi:hypothetical protein